MDLKKQIFKEIRVKCDESDNYDKVYVSFLETGHFQAMRQMQNELKKALPQIREIAFKEETLEMLIVTNKHTWDDICYLINDLNRDWQDFLDSRQEFIKHLPMNIQMAIAKMQEQR